MSSRRASISRWLSPAPVVSHLVAGLGRARGSRARRCGRSGTSRRRRRPPPPRRPGACASAGVAVVVDAGLGDDEDGGAPRRSRRSPTANWARVLTRRRSLARISSIDCEQPVGERAVHRVDIARGEVRSPGSTSAVRASASSSSRRSAAASAVRSPMSTRSTTPLADVGAACSLALEVLARRLHRDDRAAQRHGLDARHRRHHDRGVGGAEEPVDVVVFVNTAPGHCHSRAVGARALRSRWDGPSRRRSRRVGARARRGPCGRRPPSRRPRRTDETYLDTRTTSGRSGARPNSRATSARSCAGGTRRAASERGSPTTRSAASRDPRCDQPLAQCSPIARIRGRPRRRDSTDRGRTAGLRERARTGCAEPARPAPASARRAAGCS